MSENASLKKVLKPIHLWAIAVGLVISGEYFGWNYGWGLAGTFGFLITTLVVTVLYVTFIFSFTELTTSIPHAGGPFAYSHKAMGPLAGWIAGYATLVEFLFAPPAIAFALGSYVHFLYPAIPVLGTALSCYVIFTFIHFLGIKESAMFSLLVTILAVGELLLYMGLVAPSFEWQTFKSNPMPFGWSGVIAALPYAIWFYLAIEGVAMVAEEVDNPRKNIPKGYIYGIVTLVFLALGVMIFTGGAAHWEQLSAIDYPLPETLAIVLGKDNQWTKVFAGIGLFGLVASFHSTILGYSRQIFALSRAGYLPGFLSHVSPKLRTPDAALLAGGIIGIISILTGTTDKVIVLSVIGALVMYIISMVSLFVLRKKAPEMERPYSTPLYPLFPLTALILSVFSLIAIIYYNFTLSVYFTIGLVLTSFIYWMYRKNVATTL